MGFTRWSIVTVNCRRQQSKPRLLQSIACAIDVGAFTRWSIDVGNTGMSQNAKIIFLQTDFSIFMIFWSRSLRGF